MPETDDLSFDDTYQNIANIIDQEEAAPGAPVDGTESAPTAGAGADPAEKPPIGDENGPSDPVETPSIAPPDSWNAEAKDRFRQLPPDLQQVIADRAADERATFRRQQNEAADARKAADAEKQAAAQERQQYAQQLGSYVEHTRMFDPVLQQGDKLTKENGWVDAWKADPVGTGELKMAYDQRKGMLDRAAQEHQRIVQDQQRAHFAREEAALAAKLPDFADPKKAAAIMSDVRKGLVERYGFDPADIATIPNHRGVLMARDALAYHALRAQLDATAAKKVVTLPQRTVRPGSADSGAENSRVTALKQRANQSGRLEDRAAAVLEAIKDM